MKRFGEFAAGSVACVGLYAALWLIFRSFLLAMAFAVAASSPGGSSTGMFVVLFYFPLLPLLAMGAWKIGEYFVMGVLAPPIAQIAYTIAVMIIGGSAAGGAEQLERAVAALQRANVVALPVDERTTLAIAYATKKRMVSGGNVIAVQATPCESEPDRKTFALFLKSHGLCQNVTPGSPSESGMRLEIEPPFMSEGRASVSRFVVSTFGGGETSRVIADWKNPGTPRTGPLPFAHIFSWTQYPERRLTQNDLLEVLFPLAAKTLGTFPKSERDQLASSDFVRLIKDGDPKIKAQTLVALAERMGPRRLNVTDTEFPALFVAVGQAVVHEDASVSKAASSVVPRLFLEPAARRFRPPAAFVAGVRKSITTRGFTHRAQAYMAFEILATVDGSAVKVLDQICHMDLDVLMRTLEAVNGPTDEAQGYDWSTDGFERLLQCMKRVPSHRLRGVLQGRWLAWHAPVVRFLDDRLRTVTEPSELEFLREFRRRVNEHITWPQLSDYERTMLERDRR